MRLWVPVAAAGLCLGLGWGLGLQAAPRGAPRQGAGHGTAGQGAPATPDHLEHRFEDPEQAARGFDDPARDAWQMPDRVIEALGLAPGQAVADLGAGTGYFTVRLARSKAAPLVYAVEVETPIVQYVRERAAREGLANIVAVQTPAERAELPAPVDVVLVVNTYHHLPDRVKYFSDLRRLLKPAARLAVVDYRKGVPDGPPDEFRFSPEQISEELAGAGFLLKAQYEFLPRQIFLVYQLGPR